jgi:preprotein translocase subunit SecB
MSKTHTPTADFMAQRVYLKDASFEAPNSPSIFLEKWEAESTLNLNNNITKLEDNIYDVTLTITITVKIKEKTAFLVELQQAGIFAILKTFKDDQLKHLLATKCPEFLYPYARASISHLVMQGGFPAFDLPPMDFTEMYIQQSQAKKEQKAANETT